MKYIFEASIARNAPNLFSIFTFGFQEVSRNKDSRFVFGLHAY